MGVKLTQVWSDKLKVSLRLHPVGLFVAVDSRRYVYTRMCKCGWLLLSRKSFQHGTACDKKTR